MTRPFVLSIGVLALCACSKPQAPAQQPASEAPAASASVTVPSSAPPPAESSLALKRGMLAFAVDGASFQPCGQAQALWVIDQTGGVVHESLGAELPSQWYTELHGERMPLSTQLAQTHGHSVAIVLEEVLYAAPAGESRGCEQPPPDFVVAARGNEPFWAVDVRRDDTLLWRQPEEPKELAFELVKSQDAEGTVGYFGVAGDHTLELFVVAQPCRDSMSGAYFAYSARAKFDSKTLEGCARIGE